MVRACVDVGHERTQMSHLVQVLQAAPFLDLRLRAEFFTDHVLTWGVMTRVCEHGECVQYAELCPAHLSVNLGAAEGAQGSGRQQPVRLLDDRVQDRQLVDIGRSWVPVHTTQHIMLHN